jgi:hypothetical protein
MAKIHSAREARGMNFCTGRVHVTKLFQTQRWRAPRATVGFIPALPFSAKLYSI